jgi:hypothetical protein
MSTNGVEAGWAAVARETFEYNLRPWMGRKSEVWLRACAHPHPIDPRGQVLVPDRLYQVFASRPIYGRVTSAELAAAGYPARRWRKKRSSRPRVAHCTRRLPAVSESGSLRSTRPCVAGRSGSWRQSGRSAVPGG